MGLLYSRICFKPDRLFNSTKFLTLNPFILEIILKRDIIYHLGKFIKVDVWTTTITYIHEHLSPNVIKNIQYAFAQLYRIIAKFFFKTLLNCICQMLFISMIFYGMISLF